MEAAKQAKRNSNIELLRILAILLITLNHVATLSGIRYSASLTVNCAISLFMSCGGKYGVNLFVIIGAWFLADSEFSISRIWRIWFQTLAYSVVLLAASRIIFHHDITSAEVLSAISPIVESRYWYPKAYIYMLFWAPILKMTIDQLEKKAFPLIIAFGAVISFLSTITMRGKLTPSIPLVQMLFERLTYGSEWFCFIFALIYYARKYGFRFNQWNRKQYCAFAVITYFVMWLVVVACFLYGNSSLPKSEIVICSFDIARDMTSPLCFLSAFALFQAFLQWDIPFSRCINQIASHSFGIYLLQCHNELIPYIWQKIFRIADWYAGSTPLFLFKSISCVVILFLSGLVVDTCYSVLIKSITGLTQHFMPSQENNA